MPENLELSFERVGTLADLEQHGQFTKWVKDHDLLVYQHEGTVKAISNICRHFGGPVGFHKMKDETFTCLWHCYKFSAKDGTCLNNKELSLRRYRVKVEGSDILVCLVENTNPNPGTDA